MAEQGNNSGFRSKLQERFKRMKLLRSKKFNKSAENEKFIQDKVVEIRNVVRNEPSVSYKNNLSVKDEENKAVSKVIKEIQVTSKDRVYIPKKVSGDKVKDNLSKDIDIDTLKNEEQVSDISKVIKEIQATSKDRVYDSRKVGCAEKKQIVVFNKQNDNNINNLNLLNVDKSQLDVKKNIENISNLENSNTVNSVSDVNNNSQKKVEKKKNTKKAYYQYKKKKVIGQEIPDSKKEEVLDILESDILNKLKGSFEDKLDELEVLESTLFFLRDAQENEVELKKVVEIKEKIKKLVEEVNEIIEQYNVYAKNYYLDNVILIDDNVIVDDIIDYRDMLDSFNDEKRFVKEYKKLNEFQRLYLNLKMVKDDTEKLIEDNEDKLKEFDIRDKKYQEILLGAINVGEIGRKCELEMKHQDEYFSELMKKISHIDREEYTTHHLRGIGDLIGASLRYMGIMMVSPLAGLIPGIGLQAVATRRMVGQIYRNMRIEEVRHVHYEAIDYDSELNHHLLDVNYTASLLDDAFDDIKKLKSDFLLQYDSRISGYEDTLKNIEKMETMIMHSQNKVNIIKNHLKRGKKLNEDKMVLVRRMNEQDNNT